MLRLATDLQNCIKAQQSKAYANKVKLSNLQNMAKTLSYVQEHGYEAALKFLKGKADGGKLPTLQTLKAEKEKLLAEKKERQEKYYSYRNQKKELDTVCANTHAALGQIDNRHIHKQVQKEQIRHNTNAIIE